ncbi:MAG: dihydroorotase [Clostridia bacterium]
MSIFIKNAKYNNQLLDIAIDNGKIIALGKAEGNFDKVIDAKGLHLLPAFVDIHTHLREPGFTKKEDIKSGAMAAIKGGFASICCMPNTNPVADCEMVISYILNKAKQANMAKVFPIGAITKGLEGSILAEIGKMKEAGAVAISDDGRPVQNANIMRLAMEYAKPFDIKIASHCEDLDLLNGGVCNEGETATKLGLRGTTRASEEVMLSREIILANTLNTAVHICHVSTKNGVAILRDAKARGIKVTAETCPHYFSADDSLLEGFNTMAKVNPPLREKEDVEAIIKGLQDGSIDAIATDHAPHTYEDKNTEFDLAANGISGIETAFALAYTKLVKTGKISLEQLSKLMTENPANIMNIPYGKIEIGGLADLVLVDLDNKYNIDASKFVSKGKNTPFDKWEVFGKVDTVIVEGQLKLQKGEFV